MSVWDLLRGYCVPSRALAGHLAACSDTFRAAVDAWERLKRQR